MALTVAEGTRLPPGLRLPRVVQGLAFISNRRRTLHFLRRRYGTAFSVNLPIFGRAVVISDPAMVKQLYLTSTELVTNIEPNLGRVLGRGSFFNLEGDAHRNQRKLLVPPFHGRRMHAYEVIIEEETMREADSWPEGAEFETLAPMMRITLNAILRAVFGAEGVEFEQLRELLPPFVEFASRLVTIPVLDLESRALGAVGPIPRLPPAIRRDRRPTNREGEERPRSSGSR